MEIGEFRSFLEKLKSAILVKIGMNTFSKGADCRNMEVSRGAAAISVNIHRSTGDHARLTEFQFLCNRINELSQNALAGIASGDRCAGSATPIGPADGLISSRVVDRTATFVFYWVALPGRGHGLCAG